MPGASALQKRTPAVRPDDTRYAVNGVPVAGSHPGRFDPARCTYNLKPTNTWNTRTALTKALAGTGLATFLTAPADSKTVGQGTNSGASINAAKSWPGYIAGLLQARGYTIAGTGPVYGNLSSLAGGNQDSRWTFGTGWAASGAQVNFAGASASGSVLTFASDRAGTIVEIETFGNSGAFTYAIDGAAAVTYTPPGGTAVQRITVSSLANTTHTVVITTTSATATYVVSVNVRGTVGLQIANMAIGGSTSANWAAALATYQSETLALGRSCDAAFMSLGVNDARASVTIPTYKTNMGGMIAAHKAKGDRDVWLIIPTPPRTTQVSTAIWNTYVAAMYDLADSYDLPLIDLTALYQNWIIGNAKGLYYDDLHENESGYAADALTILAALGA